MKLHRYRSAVIFTLAISACDSSEPKEEPEPPLLDGKADRYATDFILAGELAPNGTLRGELTEVDRFLGYTFYGRTGDSIAVSLGNAAGGLDTVLWIYGPYDPERGRWSTKPLAVNDDHDDKLSAIELALPADGMYLAIVTSYQQRTHGAFDVSLACDGCSTAPRSGELAINEVYARPAGEVAIADANQDGNVDDGDELVEVRNVARVPVSLEGVELVANGTTLHAFTTGVLAPGQAAVVIAAAPAELSLPSRFEVAPLGLDDGGAALELRLGDVAIDDVAYPAATMEGSFARVDDTLVPHLELTQGLRAVSPGATLDGSPFPNPNTSTRIDVSDGEDAVEDARFDVQGAVAARFGKSIPVKINKLVILGPALENKHLEAGMRDLIAKLPQLQHPDPAITSITFGSGDARRYGNSVYLDAHDDGRQAFRVLSTNPGDEPAIAQFRGEADAAFAAELPLVHAIEKSLLAWLPTRTTSPGFLGGVKVTGYKLTTTYSGTNKEYRSDSITIDLASSYPSTVRVHIYYAKASTAVSSYSVTYSQAGLPILQNTVRSLGLDAARAQKYAQNYVHDQATGKLQRRTFLDEDGNFERVVFVNVPVLARDQIAADTSEQLDVVYAGLVQRSATPGTAVVGIFDSGVDYNHPALAHKLHENTAEGEAADAIDNDANGKADDFVGWDFDDEDRLPYDYNDHLFNLSQSFDHGTHVGGIASQGTDDVRIVPVRWKVSGTALAAAVDYMAARGVRVVNMSFSSTSTSTMNPLGAKIAARGDMLFVAAAGNNGENLETKPRYPASFASGNLITVAAVDDKGALTSWSNFGGVSVDLAAPGDAITSTVVGGGWGAKSGTSMATPYVVNIAGKMLALAPGLAPAQVKSILMATVDVRADFAGKLVSQGTVNAARAMRVAWLWQRVREGASAQAAIAELGLSAAEASRIVQLAGTI